MPSHLYIVFGYFHSTTVELFFSGSRNHMAHKVYYLALNRIKKKKMLTFVPEKERETKVHSQKNKINLASKTFYQHHQMPEDNGGKCHQGAEGK